MKEQEQGNDLKVLTVDELRSYDGLGDLTEQEAIGIIKSLKELSLLVHSILSNHGEARRISEFCKKEQSKNCEK